MKKYLLGVLLLLLLTACGSGETTPTEQNAEATAPNPTTSEPTDVAEETIPEAATEEVTAEEAVTEAEEEVAEGQTAVDAITHNPATSLPQAAELRDLDHTKGAEEPIIAIIEYGDFQ